MKSAPGLVIWSLSTIVWAYGSGNYKSWQLGFRHGLAWSDRFLERYPLIQREFREMLRSGDPSKPVSDRYREDFYNFPGKQE